MKIEERVAELEAWRRGVDRAANRRAQELGLTEAEASQRAANQVRGWRRNLKIARQLEWVQERIEEGCRNMLAAIASNPTEYYAIREVVDLMSDDQVRAAYNEKA